MHSTISFIRIWFSSVVESVHYMLTFPLQTSDVENIKTPTQYKVLIRILGLYTWNILFCHMTISDQFYRYLQMQSLNDRTINKWNDCLYNIRTSSTWFFKDLQKYIYINTHIHTVTDLNTHTHTFHNMPVYNLTVYLVTMGIKRLPKYYRKWITWCTENQEHPNYWNIFQCNLDEYKHRLYTGIFHAKRVHTAMKMVFKKKQTQCHNLYQAVTNKGKE